MNSELLLGLYALVFPYIFLLFDCLELALIDRIVKCKVHSVLWQLPVGGYILRFTQVNLKMNSELLLGLYVLVFPYIFLLFDCLQMALINRIVKCKVHSVLWQLEVGGGKS